MQFKESESVSTELRLTVIKQNKCDLILKKVCFH